MARLSCCSFTADTQVRPPPPPPTRYLTPHRVALPRHAPCCHARYAQGCTRTGVYLANQAVQA